MHSLTARLPVALRRLGFRIAHRMLRAWWFLRRPTLHGVKCVITDGDAVLLVRHTYGDRRWDLPGGAVRHGEPPLDTARREMEEELGVRIEHWRSLGELRARPYHSHDTVHLFTAGLGPVPLTIDAGELAAAHWFGRRSLPAGVARYVQPIVQRLNQAIAQSAVGGEGDDSGAASQAVSAPTSTPAAGRTRHSPARRSDSG